MNESIGSRIARLRKEKKMTQEALAEQMGVSAQAVSKWENDQSCPDIGLLPKLSRVLGVSTDELLTGESSEVRLVPADQRKSLDELVMRVRINSAEGDRVRANLPISLIKAAIEIGMEMDVASSGNPAMSSLKNVDMAKIVAMVEQGLVGKLVEIESADGDTVEVVVE